MTGHPDWLPRGGRAEPTYIVNTPLIVQTGPGGALAIEAEAGATGAGQVIVDLPARSYDAFRRLRTVNPQIVFFSSMQYDAAPLRWQTVATGAGNVAAFDANARAVTMTLGGTNAGSIIRQTYEYIPYQESRSQFVTMTGIMGAVTANVTQRIGYFDAANGLFFQQTSAGKAVVRRSSTSGVVDDAVALQSVWNIDKLDGTGPSGYALDWTKDQIYIIDFGWLGTARVRFGFYLAGEIIYCHALDHSNALTTSYMQSGTLPLRYEIGCSAPASAVMTQICQAVTSEGGYFDEPGFQFSGTRPIASLISTASEAPLVAVRPALTFGGIVNRVHIKPAHIEVVSASGAIGYRVLYYPPGSANPITGGAWTAQANSATEYNVSGTALSLTSAIQIAGGYVGTGTGASRSVAGASLALFYPLTLDSAGANPAYLVVSGLGAGATGGASLAVTETR